jgi:hypothetical protein
MGGVELDGRFVGYVGEVGYVGLPTLTRKCCVSCFVGLWELWLAQRARGVARAACTPTCNPREHEQLSIPFSIN